MFECDARVMLNYTNIQIFLCAHCNNKTRAVVRFTKIRRIFLRRYLFSLTYLPESSPETTYSLIYTNFSEKQIPMGAMDKKMLEKRQTKEKKWLRMIREWDETKKTPEELKSRIWKGCPDSLRGRLWPLLLRIQDIKSSNEHQHGPKIYEVSYSITK